MDTNFIAYHCDEDEEIFIGQLTLNEVKKRLNSVSQSPKSSHRQTTGCIYIDCEDDTNSSIKIIETHSAPDICVKSDLPTITKSDSTPSISPETFRDWEIKPDDSFLILEQMVSQISVTPDKHKALENTTGKAYFFANQSILQTGVKNTPPSKRGKCEIKTLLINDYPTSTGPIPKENEESKLNSHGINVHHEELLNHNEDIQVESATKDEPNLIFKTPMKNYDNKKSKLPVASYIEHFTTPSSELRTRTPMFKTPGNPSHKKQSGTPRKYQNIVSPVATYIRNCPQVPLLRDVYPKKPLPGVSSIPKPMKFVSQLNKENIKQENVKSVKHEDMKLPAVAYCHAKETKLIDFPDEGIMPQSHWARQVASSIPRAIVVKHGHRETSSAKKPLQFTQENSFADLSLHQADLSVCTQKPTFSKPKKNV